MKYFNLLRIASEEKNSIPISREEKNVAPHVIVEDATNCENIENDPELRVLSEKFGHFYEGMIIEVSLQELLELLPRTRRRSDAYRGLVSKLKRKGVSLIITSTKPNIK